MNTPTFVPSTLARLLFNALPLRRRDARPLAASCSAAVLAGLGLLLTTPPSAAQGAGGVLPVNTLPVVRGVVAGQAVVKAPVLTGSTSRLTIDQASARAVIDWRSFDIGRSAEVMFNHAQGSSASTLNRIYDANPSVIQGRLASQGPTGADGKPTAGGQLILINQNGILFDRGAQVNTQSLIASTLNLRISNLDFCGGNTAACNSGAPLTTGGLLTPAFEGGYDDQGNWLPRRPGAWRAGDIGIGSFGPANAAAPLLQAGSGGAMVFIAARVDNDGGIVRAPDGQVILAAGNKAYLSLDEGDNALRGFRIEVEANKDGPGVNLSNLVRNAGEISADRGNVSIAALAINQDGRISAKTAVQRNGTVYLKARTKDNADAGTLTLGNVSVTEVMPDSADTATLPDSSPYAAAASDFRGVIRAEAGLIENRGTLQAAGGRIGLEASSIADPQKARVFLAEGSVTSVAGAWADVDADKYLKSIRVTSNELKNSPDQKTGLLLGATVAVDLRDGNNILALDGYRGSIERTVAEKAAVGGEMAIGSTGSVIVRSGATLDASGGGYRHAGARVATSKLLAEDGSIHDIASAPQQQRYVAQLDRYQKTDDRWGQRSDIVDLAASAGVWREGYVEGLAAGTIRIGSAAGLVLDGTLKGGVTVGPRQMAAAPKAATLLVGSGLAALALNAQPATIQPFNSEGQRIGNVTWQQRAGDSLGSGFNAATALTAAQRDNVKLAAEQVFGVAKVNADGRVETGFGNVEVNSDGRIAVPADVSIRSEAGASLQLRAPAVDIAGDIRLPAGSLTIDPTPVDGNFGVDLISPDLATLVERTTIRGSATLSVAGDWVNSSGNGGSAVGSALPGGRRTASGGVKPAIDGGSITLRASVADHQARLERGAVLDVGGGAAINSAKVITGGAGGELTLSNGIANQTSPDWMQAELRGHALAQGGRLTLNLNRAVIDDPAANGTLPASTTRLSTDFFKQQGFETLAVNAGNGVEVAEGTRLTLQQRNLVVDTQAALALPSGGELRSVADVTLRPDHQRRAARLTLTGGNGTGSVLVGRDAVLETDAGGSLSLASGSAGQLSGVAGLSVLGSLLAPGGQIALAVHGARDHSAAPLHLGRNAVVSAAGTFVATPNDAGLVRGSVFGGGTVRLEATQAAVVADAGSRIDVSGVEKMLDVGTGGTTLPPPQAVAGHAGTLVVKAQRGASLNGTLAAAGPGGAAGGSFALELSSGANQPQLPPAQRLVVSADGRDAAPAAGTVTSTINVAALQSAGFQKLRLQSQDRIEFQGQSSLHFERGIRLDAPEIVLASDARSNLRAATVSLGQSWGPRVFGDSDTPGVSAWNRVDTLPQPERSVVAGNGVLSIDAGNVDFFGSLTLQGTALTSVRSSGDVRFIGREVDFRPAGVNDPALIYQFGSLDAAGALEFRASQLYPATRTRFEVQAHGAGNYLLVAPGSGTTPGDVYSAAGALSLTADTIVQQGVIRAPLGVLNLQAAQRLELAPGSVTSVSATGLSVLYGTTIDGLQWRYADGALSNDLNNPRLLDAVSPDGKRLTLGGPDIQVAGGATVDLRGGGNVLAVEFVAGNGGDTDLAAAADTYAIIPKSRLAGIPYDSFLQLNGGRDPGAGFALANPRDAALYDSVQIEAGGRVPAGEYVLLPTRFAQLPDAYLVQLQTGTAWRNLQPGQTGRLGNGETVVAGHRSARGTSVRESQSVGVVVLPGSAVSRYADYTVSDARLFADNAERAGRVLATSPWDAGAMQVRNASTLSLAGSFLTEGSTLAGRSGRTAEVDIAGRRIAVVDQVGATPLPAGTLQVSSASLSRLDASVVLGGTRQRGSDGVVTLTTQAEQVSVANTAQQPVTLPELVLTATQGVDIAAGSVLRAESHTSSANGAATALRAESSGALLRLSAGAQATLDRGNANAAAGDLNIAAGAQISAAGSLLLDATRSTTSAGSLRAGGADGSGGAISLSASRVSVGQTLAAAAGTLGGLVLSEADIAGYTKLDELTLRAYERIDLFGDTTLGSTQLQRLTLDTPLLAAVPVAGVARANINAGTVQLLNRSPVRSESSGGSGTLNVSATRLLIGQGDKASSGFGSVVLAGSSSIDTQGQGSLRSGGELALNTPALRALALADQQIAAVDSSAAGGQAYRTLRLNAPATAPAAANGADDIPALGGRLALQGGAVAIDGTVQARSGRIAVVAQGGDLTLGSRGVLDAAGQTRDFNGSVVAADGGSVALSADSGRVQLAAGSRIDVAAAAAGGNAGSLALRAREATLQGSVAGQAAAAARGGSAQIDLDTLGGAAAFSSLNTLLNSGGFSEQRALRLRSGDLALAAGDSVDSRRVNLVADQGRIHVAGSVGRNTQDGGARIDLSAAQGLTLASGSQLLAAGTGVAARGGEVRVQTRGGTLAFEDGARIDVRAGSAGPQGSVTFGVARDANDNVGAVQLRGQVLRAGGNSPASIDLEASRVYGGADVPATIGAAQITAWGNDHRRFVAASAGSALMAGLRDDAGVAIGDARVLGATEIQASGDLAIGANWNLADSASWRAGDLPGTLTVRAAGSVTLSQTLGAPGLPTGGNATTHNSNNNTNHAIVAGDTWNIRLAAGADLASADALATQAAASSTGHLQLSGANANIRTGSGRIELAAAGDIRLDHRASAIYTGGRIGAADTAVNGNNRWAVDGGSISLRAGGSVQGNADARELWVSDWLRRWRESENAFASNGHRTDWWSYRPRFQQGVGTLAGGDIDVHAGGNVSDLMFALPTSGRTVNQAGVRSVEVTGGGNLRVYAGGHVDGTPVLVGRGRASVEAGGSIGASQPLQGYLMGFSSGAVTEQAELVLSAGGNATLQSVDNPTYLALNSTRGAAGPSFHPTAPNNAALNGNMTTFFTYSANSAAGLLSKGGDVAVVGRMAPTTSWRIVSDQSNDNGTLPDALLNSGWSTAFPARLALLALGGDVAGPGSFGDSLAATPNRIKTYPSAQASLMVLAGNNVREAGVEISDLAANALVTPLNRFDKASPLSRGENFFNTGLVVSTESKAIDLGRIVQRDGSPLPFGLAARDPTLGNLSIDVQALQGDIVAQTGSLLYLPAESRIRAGNDIVNPRLQLQNLADGDVSEVRAVNGSIVRRDGPFGIEIQGPGRLLVQAGGDIDIGNSAVTIGATTVGGLVATGNNRNPLLPSASSARLTVVAGVSQDLDLAKLDTSYARLQELNALSDRIASLYAQLELEEGDSGRAAVLGADNIAALTGRNPAYSRFAELDTRAPEALAAYKAVLRDGTLPLGGGPDAAAAQRLLALLGREDDVNRMAAAGSLRAYLAGFNGNATVGGEALDAAAVAALSSLGDRFPAVFAGAVVRRQNGARLTGTAPLVFDEVLAGAVAGFIPATTAGGGSILSYLTSVQTQGGSDIDLWAPKGDVVVGLTTANNDRPVGVLSNQGGAVRGVLSGDFSINQGKVITAQGGDIMLFSAQGSIDAGRGAKTSLSTPPPQRRPILDNAGNQIGFEFVIPASATGSGIQTLTSDPDGLGPGIAPKAGDISLFAPAGKIDAGEAGIRSSGNILINAQVVLNAADIRAAGSAQGVPQVPTGSVASALAAGGSNTTGGSQAAEQAAKSAAQAARQAAAAPPPPRPTILSVEVMGFGDKNCKEDDKECFAK